MNVGIQIILDPLDAEIEERKIIDVLHRSKEQRYAFDKIYRVHTNENVGILPNRFISKPRIRSLKRFSMGIMQQSSRTVRQEQGKPIQ